jgi:hypothetical protein
VKAAGGATAPTTSAAMKIQHEGAKTLKADDIPLVFMLTLRVPSHVC